MKRSLPKEQLLIVGLCVGGLLLGLLGYVALVSPQRAQAKKLDSEVEAARVQLDAAKKTAIKDEAVHAADLFRLAKAMPASDDMSGVLIQLSRLADGSDVQILAVHPSTEVPLALGYSALPIQLDVKGTYAEITTFLHRARALVSVQHEQVHAKGRLFAVNKLDLTAGTGNVISATLGLDAFVYTGVVPATTTGATTTTTTG